MQETLARFLVFWPTWVEHLCSAVSIRHYLTIQRLQIMSYRKASGMYIRTPLFGLVSQLSITALYKAPLQYPSVESAEYLLQPYFVRKTLRRTYRVGFFSSTNHLYLSTFRSYSPVCLLEGLVITITLQGVLIVTYLATFIHHQRLNRLSRAGKLSAPLEGQIGFFYTL